MNRKTGALAACVGMLLAVPALASAMPQKSVTGTCELRQQDSQTYVYGEATSTFNTVTAPIIATGVACRAYDTVTGEYLARAGQAIYGTRVVAFAPVSVPAGHDVRFLISANAMYMDGTMVTYGTPESED